MNSNMSKLILIGFISAIFIAIVVMIGTVYVYPAWMQRTSPEACQNVTKQNAIDAVTRDFMENKLPNWGNDKDNLGTQVPSLAFISDNVVEEKGTYRVPFSAKGPGGTLSYVGNLNCSNNYIKYTTVE